MKSWILLLLSATAAMGQTASTGALAGTVLDPQDKVVQGASVRITSDATGEVRSALSGGDGAFSIPLVVPGTYSVDAESQGFRKYHASGLRVVLAETLRTDIRLEVGSIQEQLTVVANAELAQTESASLGRVVGSQVVSGLPLVTRNYTDLLALSPGVMTGVPNASEIGRGRGGLSSTDPNSGVFAHGARSYDNNFQMDGVEINDFLSADTESGGVAIPNPDSLQEFKVQTGQYDASFGRNAGANVDILTRSGTNQFHGSAFEFFRNEALNANGFFSNRTGSHKPVLRQNQFGGTIGGPIVKEKLLFFGSYQGTRQLNGASDQGVNKCRDQAFAPPLTNDRSAAALGRMFAGRTGLLGGVAIRADGSNINPIAIRILQQKLPDGSYVLPTPQTVDPSRPLDLQGFSVFTRACSFDENQFMGNLDYLQSSRSKFAIRFFAAGSDQTNTLASQGNGSVPGFPRLGENSFQNLSVAHTFIFSSRWLNEARFGYHGIRSKFTTQSAFRYSDVGINASSQADDLPLLSIIGSYRVGGVWPFEAPQQVYDVRDTVSYSNGRHSLRFGGDLTRMMMDTRFRFYGSLTFLSWPDFLLGLDAASNGSFFSNVYGSFDLIGQPDRNFRVTQGSLYAQDDIRVARRLTLNLGLRYERIGPFADQLGRNAGFDISKANPNPPATGTSQGFVVSSNYSGPSLPAGISTLSNSYGINGDGLNRIAPRIGFAWQALPDSSRLVLRGGYGMYFTPFIGQSFFQTVTSPPFSSLRACFAPCSGGFTLANPFVTPIPPASAFPFFPTYSPTTSLSMNAVAPDFQPATTHQFSMNLQTTFGRDYVLEVGYVGARGLHLQRSRDVNQALSRPPNTFTNIALRRPLQGWGRLLYIESAGRSWYNGLETSLTKRFSNGLQFLASYTWAKSLDTDGANVTQSAFAVGGIGNQNDDRSRYGPSEFLRPHRLVVSYLYELPLKGALLGGWMVSGVTTVQAGLPMTITGTNATNVFGTTTDRAQLAPGCTHSDLVTTGSVTAKLNGYFRSSCFAPAWPVVGADGIGTGFGNSGPGIVRGPDQRNFDLAIVRRFGIAERGHAEFRAEMFNVFNTPQFANPDTVRTSATFGVISSTSVNARLMQLAVKFLF